MPITRPNPRLEASNRDKNTGLIHSRLYKVVKDLACTSPTNRWPLVSVLALIVYWLSGKPNTTFPLFCCAIRASFTTICILTSLQRPTQAFNKPRTYFSESAVHLVLAGIACRFLVGRGPSTAQVPSFIRYLHHFICSLAFGMTGTPQSCSVPLPQTDKMTCWLLSMFASTLLGIVLPTLRWYLYNDINTAINARASLNLRRQAPWDVAQIAFIGCSTVSALWVVLAQIAAFLE